MDTGITIRPVQPVSIQPARVAPPVERQTVASELPETQAVVAAPESVAARSAPEGESRSRLAELNTAIDRKAVAVFRETVSKVVQDETTKELVFQKVSSDTGRIIGQFPDEALLRMKAYSAQVRSAELDKAAERGTNRA
jgi:uncharacterized FlaG/YvyC family protein